MTGVTTDTRPEDFAVTMDDRPATPGDLGEGGHDPAIRLAASVLVVRAGGEGEREILMGRRPSTSAFMPGKLVFPGGALDAADTDNTSALHRCAAEHRAVLSHYLPQTPSHALPAAALREVTEETGLALPSDTPLHLIARAITPPGRTRRFDAWFFHADIGSAACERVRQADEELSGLGWFPMSIALGEPLAAVTRFVLQRIPPKSDREANTNPPVFLRQTGGNFTISPLIARGQPAQRPTVCSASPGRD